MLPIGAGKAESHAGPWLSTALGTGMVLVKTLPAEDVPRITMPTLASYLVA